MGDWENSATADDFDQSFDLDTSGVAPEDLGGGEGQVKEGWYHFDIADVKNELDTLNNSGKEKSPCVRFDMVVLANVTKQSPMGSRHFHRVYIAGKGGKPISDGSRNNAIRFGLGLGLLKEVPKPDGAPDEKMIVDAATGLPKLTLATWARAKGMQCIAKIALEKQEEGSSFEAGYKIPFSRVYQVDDPKVADVVKNEEALQLIGKTSAKKPPAPPPAAKAANGAGKGGVKPAPTTGAPVGAGVDALADL